MPKVSVITAYYNREAVLQRTIESVLNQTFRDLELIVIDDKSTDGTAARLAEIQAELGDPRLRVITNVANKGFVTSIRDAIEETTGEYIAIQGSGDVALPERIARQVEILDRQPSVVAVGCWYKNIDDATGAVEVLRPDASAAKDGKTTFTHGEMTMRRSAYDASGGYRTEFTVAQLTDLGFRLYEIGSFATVPEVLYERHLQGDGITYSVDKIITQAKFLALANHLRRIPKATVGSVLEVVREDGVESVILTANRDVQFTLIERCLRLSIYGRGHDAEALAMHVVSAWRRALLRGLARAAQGPFARPTKWLLRTMMDARRALRALRLRRAH